MVDPERIEFLSAVLILSPDPERLAAFYRDKLGIPLIAEEHGSGAHWGCELGDIHFAIHPGDPGRGTAQSASPCGSLTWPPTWQGCSGRESSACIRSRDWARARGSPRYATQMATRWS